MRRTGAAVWFAPLVVALSDDGGACFAESRHVRELKEASF
jgi:hypothetical protein